MTEAKSGLRIATSLLLACWFVAAVAFEFDGKKWPGAEAEFYFALEGRSGTGLLWNTAFREALTEWTEATDFHYILREEYRDPCSIDLVNGIDFTDDVCGSEFGENTLAVTLISTTAQLLGPPSIIEADIVINQGSPLDIFDGNLRQFGHRFDGIDFRRIVLHELGHALGLKHEPSNPAMMASTVGNLDRLTEDDIAGVNTLYGGLSNCTIRPLSYGQITDSLAAGDCTVDELTVGGGDFSFIDVYSFELTETTTLQFEMASTGLDSVLILADSKLQYLRFDNKQSGACSSSLGQTLDPGSYFLLANTFDVQVQEACGTVGAYELTVTFSSSGVPSLGNGTSRNGAISDARFTAGITADNGNSFGNQFSASESLDLDVRIDIDPMHVGQPGFLIIAAIIDGKIFLLNQQGQFISYPQGSAPLIRASSKVLDATEQLAVLTDFVPAEVGINNIAVDFLIGYGLDSDRAEVYFHQIPLNLIIIP